MMSTSGVAILTDLLAVYNEIGSALTIVASFVSILYIYIYIVRGIVCTNAR